MSKPEWTKIGNVEVCVGTDGVTGVAPLNDSGALVFKNGVQIAPLECKHDFELVYCKHRHTIRHCADGSCVVWSTEQDEQGRPLRCALVREGLGKPWACNFSIQGFVFDERHDAIAHAVRYVETGRVTNVDARQESR